jgi:hypothetical protein
MSLVVTYHICMCALFVVQGGMWTAVHIPPWIRHNRYTHVLQDRPACIQSNIEALSRDHCWRGKVISMTCSECVSLALVRQHVKMHRFKLSSATCLAVPYISALSYNRQDFSGGGGAGGVIAGKMCFCFLYGFRLSHFLS